MIAYLEGRLEHVSEAAIIVVTDGGTGYEVEVTSRLRQGLPERGGRVRLYTSLLVREDMLRLCGFETWEERETFDILTALPKVGPKLALGILSVYRPAQIRELVANGDQTGFTVVSGVGKRLAEVLVRELSYKLKVDVQVNAADGTGAVQSSVTSQVLDGLKGLGYAENECAPIVQELVRKQPDIDVATCLRQALQAIGRRAL